MINRWVYTISIILVLTGCEYEKVPAPKLPHTAIKTDSLISAYTKNTKPSINASDWKTADYFVVSLANVQTNNIDTTIGVLNGNGTFSGLNSFNNGDSIKLILRSLYNDSSIYILAEWKDASLDPFGRIWLWDGPADPRKSDDSMKWTTQKNDDKLVLKFNNSLSSSFTKDIWEWSVALSEPLGYAIDMNETTNNLCVKDAGTPMFVRNGFGNRSGPIYEFSGESQIITRANGVKNTLDAGYFLYNKVNYTGNPESGYTLYKNTCLECHGEGNVTGYAPQLNQSWVNTMSRQTIKETILNEDLHSDGYSHVNTLSDVELDNIFAWLRGQVGIPGYYIQQPSGSVADVWTESNVLTGKINLDNKNGYKVLFSRRLKTSQPDDIEFNTTQGSAITLDILLSNSDSINYVGALNQRLIFKKN